MNFELHRTCLSGDLGRTQTLVAEGADKNAKNSEGLQPIHCACISGNLALVQWLLSQGAQLNSRDDNSMSPLHYACSNGHLETVQWLMSQKVFKNNRNNDGMTPLLCACANGHLAIVQLLIAEKVFDFATNKDGNTALHLAYSGGHKELAEWLIQYGMDADAKNKDGKTPLELFGQVSDSNPSVTNNSTTAKAKVTIKSTRRDESLGNTNGVKSTAFDIDHIEAKSNAEKSKLLQTPERQRIIAEKQEKAEARRRALAQARAETEQKLRILSNPPAPSVVPPVEQQIKEAPGPKVAAPAVPTGPAVSTAGDSQLTTSAVPADKEPAARKAEVAATNGASEEKEGRSHSVPVRFRLSLDPLKKVYTVQLPVSSPWEAILATTARECNLFKPEMVQHLLLFDKDDDELSPSITTASKFWRYAESFKSDPGMVFVMFTTGILDPNQPPTPPPAPTSNHVNYYESGKKMIRARLASDLSQRTAISAPTDCPWDYLTKEIVSGLGLGKNMVIRHLVLIDADGDELSPPLPNGQKFWKYVPKYFPEQGMYFIVYVDRVEGLDGKGMSSPNAKNQPSPTDIIHVRAAYDFSLEGKVHITPNSNWDDVKRSLAIALPGLSPAWVTHIVMIDGEGDVLCQELNTDSKFWKYHSKFKNDEGVVYIVHVDEIRRQRDIQTQKLEDARAASKLFKVKLYSSASPAVYDVYILPDSQWDAIIENIAATVGSIQSEWVSHLILMDADGDVLSPPLDNTSKFWKIGSKYRLEDKAVFVVTINEEKKAEYLRQKALEEQRAASKHVMARLAKDGRRPTDVYIPHNCDWNELTNQFAAALGFELGSFVHHLVLMDSEGDMLTPPLLNAPQFWKICAKYRIDEGAFFVVHEDEAVKAEYARKKALEEQLKYSVVFHMRLSPKGSRKVDVRVVQDCSWEMLTQAISQALTLPEGTSVHHLVLHDSEGDVLSPELNNGQQFWKFGTRLRTDEEMVFLVYLEEVKPVSPPSPPKSKSSSKETSGPLFRLAADPSISFYLPLDANINWNELVKAICSKLGEQYPTKAISHIVLVDEEGDDMSPALSNTKTLMKHISRYQAGDGQSFLIHLVDNFEPGGDLFHFVLAHDNSVSADVGIPKNCPWEAIIKKLSDAFTLRSERIKHVALVDADGDAQSPAVDNAKKFWKYAGRYDGDGGSKFQVIVEIPDGSGSSAVSESVYAGLSSETSLEPTETERRILMELDSERQRRIQAEQQFQLQGDLREKLVIGDDEYMSELRTAIVASASGVGIGFEDSIKVLRICLSKFDEKVEIAVNIESTWDEFRHLAAAALHLRDPSAIQYVVLIDGDAEDHGPHIKGMSKLFKYYNKYEKDPGMAFVIYCSEEEAVEVIGTAKAFKFTTPDHRRNADIRIDERWQWADITATVSSILGIPRSDPIFHFLLLDAEGDTLSPELKSTSRFWKYANRHFGDKNASFLVFTRSSVCQRVVVSLSSEPSVHVELYLQPEGDWDQILDAIAEGLGGIKTTWIHHLQLVDSEGDTQSPEIDNATKFWKYAHKSADITEGHGTVVMVFLDEAALEAEVAALEAGEEVEEVEKRKPELHPTEESMLEEEEEMSGRRSELVSSSHDSPTTQPVSSIQEADSEEEDGEFFSPPKKEKAITFDDATVPKAFKVRLASDRSRQTDVIVQSGCSWEELSVAIAAAIGTFKPSWMESLILMDDDDEALSPIIVDEKKFWHIYTNKYNFKNKGMSFVVNIDVSAENATEELIKACTNGDLTFAIKLHQMGTSLRTKDAKGVMLIHHAAMAGHKNILEWLVTSGVAIDTPDPDGMTPLHYVCNNSFEPIIEWMIESGANVLAKNKVGLTPIHYLCLRGLVKQANFIQPHMVNLTSSSGLTLLHCACDGGKYDMVKFLISRGAHVHSQDCEGLTPLHYACLGGHLDIAKILVENSAYWNTRDDEGMSPLHYACSEGHLDMAQWLFTVGANLNARNDLGNSPLHLACESKNIELVSWLIGRGMDISVRNKLGFTPLHTASEAGNTEIANYLCAMGATMNMESPAQAATRLMQDEDAEAMLRSTEAEEEATKQGPGTEVPIYAAENVANAYEDPADSSLRDACARGDIDAVRKMILSGGSDIHSQNVNGSNPLHFACVGGHLELAELLLSAGADLDAQNLKGFSALHFACDRKHPKLAMWLIKKGASITQRNAEGYTPVHYICVRGLTELLNEIARTRTNFDPNMTALKDISLLHCAAEQGHDAIIHELVSLGSLVDAVDADNKTPLHYACLRGHMKAAKSLVEHDAYINSRDYRGSTPLFYACSGENVVLSQWLVASGAVITCVNRRGNSCLHVACQIGNLALARWLVESGLEIRAKNKKNFSAMDFATKGGFSELVEYLNSKMSEYNEFPQALPEMISGFHSACSAGNVDLIIQFLQARMDPNVRNEDGTTALHFACLSGLLGIVRRLVTAGARINAPNEAGLTPFHCAIVNGHLSVAQWLVQQGANPLHSAGYGNTGLHIAAQAGHLMIVDWLIRMGLDVNAETSDGLNVLYYAVYHGHTDIVKLLLKCGGNCKSLNKIGGSAMHAACAQGRLEIAQMLKDHGASIDEADKTKMTPFLYASLYGHLLVARWLVSQGARVHFVGGASDRSNSGLHLACQNGHTDIAVWLIDLGLNPSSNNEYKASPILYATSGGHAELAQWLTQRGAVYFEEWTREEKDYDLTLALRQGDFDLAVSMIRGIIETAEKSNKVPLGSTPLHFAAAIGSVELAKYLVSSGADINAESAVKMTPVHFAAATNNKGIVVYLMSLGAKVNVRDQAGNTPLAIAQSNKHVELAQFLKMHGATLGHQNDSKGPVIELEQSYLMHPTSFVLSPPRTGKSSGLRGMVDVACFSGSKKDRRKDKDENLFSPSRRDREDASIRDDKSMHSVFTATTMQQSSHSRSVMSIPPTSGSQIDEHSIHSQITTQSKPQSTASLFFACMPSLVSSDPGAALEGRKDIENGNSSLHSLAASTNPSYSLSSTTAVTGSDFSIALHEACIKGDLDTVTLLVEGGASVNAANPNGLITPLHLASAAGNMSLTQFLVKKGAKINLKNSSGMSALHIVIDRQNPQLALYLVKKGADLASRNKLGETPIHKMCLWGMDTLLRQIINLPRTTVPVLDLEIKTDKGLTPLHCAVDQGFLDVVQLLLEQRVEVNCRDENNRTPLHYACLKGYPEIIDQLVTSGAFINCRDNQGLSPLLCACAAGHLPLAKWLVENGANIFSETELGNNALHVACKAGNMKMSQWLVSSGLNCNEKNTEGMSPLHFAQAGNHIGLLNWLIERGGADASTLVKNPMVVEDEDEEYDDDDDEDEDEEDYDDDEDDEDYEEGEEEEEEEEDDDED